MSIDCGKIKELLGDYLDEELQAVVMQELEEHLEDCPDCQIQVDSVKKVIRLYRKCTPDSMPIDIQIRLQDVIKRARESEGS